MYKVIRVGERGEAARKIGEGGGGYNSATMILHPNKSANESRVKSQPLILKSQLLARFMIRLGAGKSSAVIKDHGISLRDTGVKAIDEMISFIITYRPSYGGCKTGPWCA